MRLYVLALLAPLGCGGASSKAVESPAGRAEPDPEPTAAPAPEVDDDGEDGDGVSIEGLKGHLDPDDIHAGLEPYGDRLSQCYLRQVGGQKFIGGAIVLKFKVATDGAVKEVFLEESNLGAWPVERCLLAVGREISFAKPKGGEAEFTVPLDFSGRGRLVWWDEDKARAEVEDKLTELASCNGPPNAAVVTLYVGVRGQVKSVGFAAGAPVAEEWAECAAGVMLAWTLTDPRGIVAKLSFRYPTE